MARFFIRFRMFASKRISLAGLPDISIREMCVESIDDTSILANTKMSRYWITLSRVLFRSILYSKRADGNIVMTVSMTFIIRIKLSLSKYIVYSIS